VIAHWDELEAERDSAGRIPGTWTELGRAAGSKTVGLNRIQVDPGKWSTPFHRHMGGEEIFFVLGVSGVCLLRDAAFDVRPGDCIVHRRGDAHALRAGADGLDVLAFGTRGRTEVGHLPRVGVAWTGGGTWVEASPGTTPGRGRRPPANRSRRRSVRALRASSTSTRSTDAERRRRLLLPGWNKIYFRGLGLVARLEDIPYDDGEPR